MSVKAETTFIRSVNKLVSCHYEKNNNPFNSGTPDVWYSGMHKDLWVEYKFIVVPKRGDTMLLPALTRLQHHWLTSRSYEGRNVWVIVGCKGGGVIWPEKDWEFPYSTAVFKTKIMSRLEIAAKINAWTMLG